MKLSVISRHLCRVFAVVSILISFASCGTTGRYTVKDGKIIYPVTPRPADQQCMIGFRTDPIDTVRVGFIGLGMRGPDAVVRFTYIEGVKIVALCDLFEDRVEAVQKMLDGRSVARAAGYFGEEGWKELCDRDDIDLVYICTPWQNHVEMAVYAMNSGKHVAVEVPAATSIEECWALVNTAERTRRHCMMLENCCYDFFELTTLNMAQQGVFGEIIHAEGSYQHCLDPFWKAYQGNWRMDFNQKHRGDVYPTHGLGPVCQVLNIHRGDRMEYLVSVDTDPFKGKEDAKRLMDANTYANGDNTCTIIKTLKGKTILIEHGVVTPRPYSRMYQITGTEGFANKYPNQGLAVKAANLDKSVKDAPDIYDLDAESYAIKEVRDSLMALYQHPITKEGSLVETARKVGGHGGMDFIMDYRLIYCLRNGLPLDQDVYDAAEWSCMTELSGVSCAHGGMPVMIPDFTRGEWDKVKGLQLAL